MKVTDQKSEFSRLNAAGFDLALWSMVAPHVMLGQTYVQALNIVVQQARHILNNPQETLDALTRATDKALAQKNE